MPTKKPADGYAFWQYDLFPYLLGSPIDHAAGEERHHKPSNPAAVYVPAYQGFVNPKFVLPNAEGKALCEALDLIKQGKEDHEREVREMFRDLVNDALKAVGAPAVIAPNGQITVEERAP